MGRSSLLASLLALLGLVAPMVCGAQAGLPVTPDPKECTRQPPTVDAFLARLNLTPEPPLPPSPAGAPSPTSSPTALAAPPSFALPDGPPVDAATHDAIVATLRELVACRNTAHPLAEVPFVTERCLRGEWGTGSIPYEAVDFFRFWEESPLLSELPQRLRVTLLGVRETRALPDGRVGALVDWLEPAATYTTLGVEFVWFAPQPDGRWLADDAVLDLEGQHPAPPPPGTPTVRVGRPFNPVPLVYCGHDTGGRPGSPAPLP